LTGYNEEKRKGLSSMDYQNKSPRKLSTLCVYCGSADGLAENYLEAARETGERIARQGMTLVYGAGKTGMMGALAAGALAADGEVIGVISENLNQPQLIHSGLTRLEVVPDIHQRKARMSALADAFIALPGGFGTLDELFETLTWAQIGLHAKPTGLLNTSGYYDPLLHVIKHAEEECFIYPEHRALLVTDAEPDRLIRKLADFSMPNGLDRWINR